MTKKKNRNNDQRLAAALAAFTLNYGGDETKLSMWQKLCEDCGVQVGPSIIKCKRVLKGVAINIWDLTRARETNQLPCKRFPSKEELRVDLKTHARRRYPLDWAKENRLLCAFLVQVS